MKSTRRIYKEIASDLDFRACIESMVEKQESISVIKLTDTSAIMKFKKSFDESKDNVNKIFSEACRLTYSGKNSDMIDMDFVKKSFDIVVDKSSKFIFIDIEC